MRNRLRESRINNGLNQRQLAEKAHTPQSLVSSIERGVIKPWPKVIKRLSKALKVPVNELFPDDFSK
ncbi:helix-turn-helix transcriptional regulator [Chloroflexota bacterium]